MELFWDSADPMIQRSEWLYTITQTDKINPKCADLLLPYLVCNKNLHTLRYAWNNKIKGQNKIE